MPEVEGEVKECKKPPQTHVGLMLLVLFAFIYMAVADTLQARLKVHFLASTDNLKLDANKKLIFIFHS